MSRVAQRYGPAVLGARWTTLLALAAVFAAGGESAARPRSDAAASRCFGAASRDRAHPCHDPRLDHTVKPQPQNAPLVPNAPCRPEERDGPASFLGGVGVCAIGAPAPSAVRTFALIGDSHPMTWRAALETVTAAKQ